MAESEAFVVYRGSTFIDGKGKQTVSYLYLSHKDGGGINPIKAVTGEREWLPMLTDKVETFDTRYDATRAASVYGGIAGERAVLERSESINEGVIKWTLRGGEGMGLS